MGSAGERSKRKKDRFDGVSLVEIRALPVARSVANERMGGERVARVHNEEEKVL